MKTSVVLLSLAGLVRAGQGTGEPLKQLSLEALGNTEVTSVSKEPVKVTRTPAAIYVITQDDIRRSGVTSIPDALRLAPDKVFFNRTTRSPSPLVGIERGFYAAVTWRN